MLKTGKPLHSLKKTALWFNCLWFNLINRLIDLRFTTNEFKCTWANMANGSKVELYVCGVLLHCANPFRFRLRNGLISKTLPSSTHRVAINSNFKLVLSERVQPMWKLVESTRERKWRLIHFVTLFVLYSFWSLYLTLHWLWRHSDVAKLSAH